MANQHPRNGSRALNAARPVEKGHTKMAEVKRPEGVDVAPHQKRRDLITEIGRLRQSQVITYFLGDRYGAQAQISEDQVRILYDHLQARPDDKRIDLFLYSIGGQIEIPWRIVSMFREFTGEFSVLIPYKAMSAATMISLGADEIVLGRKGELGPIDPQLTMQRSQKDGPLVQEQLAVEDVMSYLRFLRDKASLTDQAALAGPVLALTSKLDPQVLGSVNRVHSHIRMVARKLLTSRGVQQIPDEQRIQAIIETLAERTYQHGHAIGRKEAEEVGLKIVRPDAVLETAMWNLYLAYEELCLLRKPIDQRTFIPSDEDEHNEELVLGCIESDSLSHHFVADVHLRKQREAPQQITINLNPSISVPANLQGSNSASIVQQVLEQALQQMLQQAKLQIQQLTSHASPVKGYDSWAQDSRWQLIDDWPVTP